MIGSIIGDIAGCPYEGDRLVQDKRDYRPFFLNGLAKFTDDTNLTIAVAEALLTGKPYHEMYMKWYTKNPDLGYGSGFKEWCENGGNVVKDSWANGAAMRVSPIALYAVLRNVTDEKGDEVRLTLEQQLEWAFKEAVESTKMTHNTDEARNGALAVTTAMILASHKYPKKEIQDYVTKLSGYDLTANVETVRNEWTKRDIRCNITVPQALICFLESTSFEDCIRLSVYSKGDVDTIAAIAGGIAEHFYGVESINAGILVETKMRLQPEMIAIINDSYGNQLKW